MRSEWLDAALRHQLVQRLSGGMVPLNPALPRDSDYTPIRQSLGELWLTPFVSLLFANTTKERCFSLVVDDLKIGS